MTGPALVYALCVITCVGCALLLLRAWLKTRVRLLMWAAAAFTLLAFNNFFLFADVILLPDIDLSAYRFGAAILGVATMIVGFIWESE
jgi:hypothetical protein